MKKLIYSICLLLAASFAFANSRTILKSTFETKPPIKILNSGEEQIGLIVKAATLWIGLPDGPNAMAFLKISEGTKVLVLEQERGFYRINHREVIGYVEQDKVKIVTPEPAVKEDNAEARIEPPKLVHAKVEKNTSNHTPTPKTTKATPLGDYQVTLETSLRAAPDHRSKVLTRLPVGGQVQFLERTDKYWWKVRYEGKTGWAKCALLKKQ